MAARGGADIAAIFDVLGYEHLPGLDAMDLPGAVILTFLPFTPYADAPCVRAPVPDYTEGAVRRKA